MAREEENLSIAALSGGEGDSVDRTLLIADMDFGEIETFDSNTAPAPFSSQAFSSQGFSSQAAPEAVMAEDGSVRRSRRERREKRDHKPRSSQEGALLSSSVPEGALDSTRNRRRSKRKSAKDAAGLPSSSPQQIAQPEEFSNTPWDQLLQEAEAASSQMQRKRKLRGSANAGEQRKKHRSHGHEPNNQKAEEDHGASEPTAASSLIRKGKEKHRKADDAIYEGYDAAFDLERSRSAARLRRRGRSAEAWSNENGGSASGLMETDSGEPERAHHGATAVLDDEMSSVTDKDLVVERIVREAWREHQSEKLNLEKKANGEKNGELNGKPNGDSTDRPNGQDEIRMPDQYPPELLAASLEASTAETQQPSPKGRKLRKRAKPTFFEMPISEAAVDDDDAAAAADVDVWRELPSPSAATPKPRNRTKKAAKKESRGRKPKREKPGQAVRDGSGNEGTAHDRRNRLAGYTRGRFSDDELARIADVVENFRVEQALSQPEVNHLIQQPGGTAAGRTNEQLWLRIFAVCPDRHRQKLINITRKKFHNFVARGTWTAEQDAELTALISVHGTKWSHIAALINRHPEDLRDRYRNYTVCGRNQRKDAWTEEEEARLTQCIMGSMRAVDALRIGKPEDSVLWKSSYEELIDWQDISERMDRTRSRLQCITKWKAMNLRISGGDELACTQPDSRISFRLEKARRQLASMPGEERYRLVVAIHCNAVGKDVKIPWQRLVDKMFRNQWHKRTQMLLWRRLRSLTPCPAESTVWNATHYLMEYYKSAGELPDVPDELFDDADEMQFMESIASFSRTGRSSQADAGPPVSSEFVAESDEENSDAENKGGEAAVLGREGEQAQPSGEEMKIDPALVGAAAEPQAAYESTPSRKSRTRAPALMENGDESDFDDMEDVPARIAAN
ncbi:hypothetical protein UVI_02042520 [Ustilaginoidea virens]|uniref:Myb transcription factor n=1 Tax=Ustilaginoidea virens TaxID=1159556 RepID=A0A1B5L4I5_USTVR|nr:hypothetical protein UVI_02042520 [Ustilaginoidea virens]